MSRWRKGVSDKVVMGSTPESVRILSDMIWCGFTDRNRFRRPEGGQAGHALCIQGEIIRKLTV